ncbi:MAG: DUF3696 domain-containing protein [Micropruina sp.]
MRWTVEDFKGLKSAQLDLTPGRLTVLTGVNSSGKSSLLQSVLLAAQSLYHEGPVVLNGPLVRLGDAHDLVRDGSASSSVKFTLDVSTDGADDHPGELFFTAHLELVPTEDKTGLHAKKLTMEETAGEDPLLLDRQNSIQTDVELVTQYLPSVEGDQLLHLKSLLGTTNRSLRTYVVMNGFVPTSVVQLDRPEAIEAKYKRALSDMLAVSSTRNSRSQTGIIRGRALFAPVVREFTRLLWEQRSSVSGRMGDLVEGLSGARSGNPYTFELVWKDLSPEERTQLIDLAAQTRMKRPYVRVPVSSHSLQSGYGVNGLLERNLVERLGVSLSALVALSETLDSLASRVEYLGPLRDEPRVVWSQWNELSRGLPVGTRGEYSATVLSRSAKRVIRYRSPEGEELNEPLARAVDKWLKYLDIGDAVSAKGLGKLGVGMQISVEGVNRDLTAVGVGVSQALPLVVALLAVEENSLFIVEQPELHLHPAVQGRLADFLLSSRPGVGVLVETHSEALVTRLRRRVAEGVRPNQIAIVFTERESGGAVTRELALSEYGDLSEWPTGFLSTSEEDVRAILKANLPKVGQGAKRGS